MYAFFRLAVLSLTATSVVAQYSDAEYFPSSSSASALATPNPNAPKSYEAWVQTLPTCYQSCQKQFFDEEYGSSCGADSYSSSAPKDLNCICNAIGGMNWQDDMSDQTKGTACVKSSCGGQSKSQEIADFGKEKGLIEMCKPYSSDATTVLNAWPTVMAVISSAIESSSATHVLFPFKSTFVMGGVVGGVSMLGAFLILA